MVTLEVFEEDVGRPKRSYEGMPAGDLLFFVDFLGGFLVESRKPCIEKRMGWNYR